MNVSDVIDPSFSYRLITTFMHFLWQGSLVAVLAALGETLLSRTSASRRYTLHVAALTIMIVCVAVTFLIVAAPSVSTKVAPIVPTTQLIVQGHEDVKSSDRPSTLKPPIVGVETPLPELPPAVGTVEIVEPPLVGQERLSGIGRRWQQLQHYAPQIAALYFVCCGMLLARLVRGTWVAHRLRRLATTVSDDSLIAMLQRQSKELGLRVMPRVAWCAEVSIPLVIGIFKPVILLPVVAATGLSPYQLQALITHELAHIRRYDLLVNLAQRIVESMLFFHPAVWYISRRISSEREQACDELVLATGCERLRYADALVCMAELSSSLRRLKRTAPATSLAASGANSSEFKRRVLKVLSVPSTSDQQPSRIALLVIMALIVGAAVSASRLHLNLLAQIPPEPTPTAVMPPKGLEFLKPYPKLQGLSLDMTEPQFLKIVKQQELKTKKTGEGDKTAYHIGLGDRLTLIVMFHKDGTCRGIQRSRGEGEKVDEKLQPQVSIQEVVRGVNFAKVKVHGHDEESLRQIRELYGPDPENPGSLKMPKNVFPMPLGEHTWLMYPAGSGHFYFEHRPDGTPQSELIYGPIDGDPFEVLKLDELFRERLKPGATGGDPRYRLTLMFHTGDPQLIRRAWRLIEPELDPKSSVVEKGSSDAEPAARYSDRDEWRGQRLESLERVREALRDEPETFRKPELSNLAKQMRETVAAVEGLIDAINDSVPDESYQSATYLQPKIQGKLPDTLWGKPVSGLRLGLVPTNSGPTGADWNTLPADASLPTRIGAESGEPLHYLLMVENVSDHEIKFSGYVTGEDHGRSIEIMDRHSKPMMHSSLHTSIWHDISHWRLKPGERKLLTMPAVYFHRETLNRSHTGLGYHVTVPDGRYSLRCSVYFGRLDQERHRHVPGKSEWIGKLTTGTQTITFGDGGTDAPATTPAVGLDFLKPYPKLHGLSLDMTERQFLEIVKQQELKTRKTVEGEKVTHHIGLGDGHSLIVMFDKDSKCSGIQRVRGESNAGGDANSERDEPKQIFLKSDPIAKYGDQLAVSWVKAGDRRSPSDVLLISVLKDGTVIAAGDSNRNRECQIKLTAAQFDELLKDMDEVDHCFDLAPDGEYVIKPGQPYNQWDHGADWLRIRRGQKEIHVGLVGSWNVGQEEHTPGVSTCRKVMARLYPLINVTRAGGWDEIERLLPIANAVLKQSFPELPPLTAKDFSTSERFQYPARSIYFRRMGADGEKFGVELERRDDGTVNPISVWNGGDIRDVEKPLVVRGLDLAKIPFTKEWKEMEKLRVLTDSGYTFKPEYSAYEVAPETWACYLPKEDKFYVEVGNNQRRRKLYGPIAGSPLKVLNPPPVPEKTDNAAANANRQRDLLLADLVRVFNDENQQLRQGLNQPALTEDEVIAVIKRDTWQRKDSPLNEQEITAFKAVAESKRLPEYAHFHLETEDETETFVWKKFWRVRLMLPAIGRDGHVSLTIRDTKVAEEKIDSKQVAWGKPDTEGLTLGIYLLPRKAQYEIGDRVRLRFLVRNNGQQPVKTMWPGISVPMPDAFTVNDQTGAKVAVNIGHKNWDSPWTILFKNEMLGVGEVHGLTVPYEISIGGGGSKNSLIGRVINARPGQTLQLKVREHNGSTRKEGEAEQESGSVLFDVGDASKGVTTTRPPAEPGTEQKEFQKTELQQDTPLADVVRDFNAENKQLGRGLDQPAMTEDEVIADIRRDKWKRGDPWSLNDKEIATFKAVAESKRLPKGSYLDVHTEDRAETFLFKQLWQVRLMIPAIGHDGFVGLIIRDKVIAEEKIDPKHVAWGTPDVDGLVLGAYLSPRKAQYSVGERVRLRLFVRNGSTKIVGGLTFPNVTTTVGEDFTVTDQTGAKVAVLPDRDLRVVGGARGGGLAPGDVHAFHVLGEISIGGDGAKNQRIGQVIDARPSQKLQLKVRAHNGNDRERQQGKPEPESSSISFTVAEGPIDSNAGLPNSDEDTNPTNNTSKTR